MVVHIVQTFISAIATSICLDPQYPDKLNQFLQMTNRDVKRLVNKEWSTPNKNIPPPLWDPVMETPSVVNHPKKIPDYFSVKDFGVEAGYPTRSKFEPTDPVTPAHNPVTTVQLFELDENELNSEDLNTDSLLIDRIKQIGCKKFILNAKQMFDCDTRSSNEERKINQLQPLDLLTDVQALYEDRGSDSEESDDENDYRKTYSPLYERSYEQELKKGRDIYSYLSFYIIFNCLIGKRLIFPGSNVYEKILKEIIHYIPGEGTNRERVSKLMSEYREIHGTCLPPRLPNFVNHGLKLDHHCQTSIISTAILAASLEPDRIKRTELHIMVNSLFSKLASRLLAEATLVRIIKKHNYGDIKNKF